MSTSTVSYRTVKMQRDRRGHPLKRSTSVQTLAVVKRCQWNGIIDEVVVFNVTLDDDQVAKLGEGIEGALDVDAAGKMATTLGQTQIYPIAA